MGKDWTKEELEHASKAMMANGHLGYKEFCEKLSDEVFKVERSKQERNTIKKEVRS